jgi:predicted Zn-dependent peptidase
MQAPQMQGYFTQRYSADNTVLALTGKVDFDAAVQLAQQMCGSWEQTRAGRDSTSPRAGGREFLIRSEKVTRAYAMLAAPGPGAGDDDRYAAFVMAQALGGPDNSRLHWAQVEPGLAEEAEASFDPHDGTGDLRVLVACDPERLDETWGKALAEIEGLAQNVTDEDVERIRAKVATGVTLAGERPEGRMHRLGRQWTYLKSYTTLEQELERINAVTVADVRRLLERFPWRPRTVGTLLPAEA